MQVWLLDRLPGRLEDMIWHSRATLVLAIIAAVVVPSVSFSASLAARPKLGGVRVAATWRPAPVGGLASLAMQLADGTKEDEASIPNVGKELDKPKQQQQQQRAPVESPQSSRIPQASGSGSKGSASKSSSSGQDWAVRLVESSPDVRRAIAFPVAFASSANWLSQCIYVAAKLRIPDALADGPMAVDQLAREVNAHPEALGRLLRSLPHEFAHPEQTTPHIESNRPTIWATDTEIPGQATHTHTFTSRQHKKISTTRRLAKSQESLRS